ncbi:hypothetical protein E2542_SST21144 [Spatholobus suberectus]|nr:hypothetical protein E2542_SST21144 [Spatholobus suberectus]
MDDMEYMKPEPGNMNILVHFLEKKGDPTAIRNVDLDRFGMFDATDSVNMITDDVGLPPCHPFILWFQCGGNGKILPLVNDKDVMLMFTKNKNCLYIHIKKNGGVANMESVQSGNTDIVHNGNP